jgi:predicted nucleic acid-binding protein
MPPEDELVAPFLLLAETTSVLTEHAYRQVIPASQARCLIESAVRLPVRLLDNGSLYPRAFDIARALGWAKAYDALYVATAEHEGAELLTVDRRMRDAARRLGIRASLVR